MTLRRFVVLLLLALPVAAAAQPDSPYVMDLVPQVVDLVARTESLGGAVSQTESASEVEILVSTDVLFRFDRATLTPRAQSALVDIADQIERKARGTVRIEGHTDSKGSDAYNLTLSRRRARAVLDALERLLRDVDVEFVARGSGESRPVARNTKPDGSDNPAGRRKNRRVEILFGK